MVPLPIGDKDLMPVYPLIRDFVEKRREGEKVKMTKDVGGMIHEIADAIVTRGVDDFKTLGPDLAMTCLFIINGSAKRSQAAKRSKLYALKQSIIIEIVTTQSFEFDLRIVQCKHRMWAVEIRYDIWISHLPVVHAPPEVIKKAKCDNPRFYIHLQNRKRLERLYCRNKKSKQTKIWKKLIKRSSGKPWIKDLRRGTDD